MKKKVLIAGVIFGLILVSGGQLFSADVGIKLGLSRVDASLSDEIPGVEFSSRSEFIIGAFVSINLFKILAIQPEVYFLTKGVNLTDEDEFSEMKFSYLEIPVLLKFNIPTPGKIKPGIFMGPYMAFNTKAWVIETEYGLTVETDLEEFAKSMDYGLILGGCLEYKLGFGKLILDVRYNLGLVSVVKNLSSLTSGVLDDDDSIKVKSFTIMIGFGF